MHSHGPEQQQGLALLAKALPWLAMAVMNPAHASKALSVDGALGLQYETYDYVATGTDLGRTRWEKTMDLNAKGFIWDPRFVSFGAAVTLLDSDVDSNQADTGQDYLGYQLNTTWFGHRRHPFNLYASQSSDIVSHEEAPSYELATRTLGMRWGLDNARLGNLNFSYDTQQAKADGSLVARDEDNQQLAIEGRRSFQGEKDTPKVTDLSYGYRYNEATEQVTRTEHRQHYLYAYERSVLDERTQLSLNASYYEREDSWQDPLNITASQDILASSFFSLNSTLSRNTSAAFSHHYNAALSRSEFETGGTDTYALSGGFNAIVNPRWTAHGSMGISDSIVRNPAFGDSETMDSTLQSGMRYTQAFGDYHVNGAYTFSYHTPLVSSAEAGARVQSNHVGSLGYSRYTNPAYQDALSYRIAIVEGRDENREQNSRYAITSLLANGDSLLGSIDYRDYYQSGSTSWSKRLDLTWNHRLGGYNTLNLGAGWSESGGQTADTQHQHLQLRLRWTPRHLRRLIVSALARTESERLSGTGSTKIATLEADASYSLGLWETQARYRLRDLEGGLRDLREQTLMLHFKRRLPGLL